MSLVAVFRKDFRDAGRSKTLWAAVGSFVALAGLSTFGYTDYMLPGLVRGTVDLGTDTVTIGLVRLLSGQLVSGLGPIPLVVPLIGLLLGYKAVVGERETGQLKFLLGLPHSRLEVVLGKFLGRSSVALVALVAGFLLTAALLVRGAGLALGPFLALVVVTTLFALAHVAIGIGISSASSSDGVATVGIVTFYALFQVAWGGLFLIVENVFLRPSTASPGYSPPDWFLFLKSISPANAFNSALDAALSMAGGIPREFWTAMSPTLTRSRGAEVPFYLADWFGFVILAAWIVVPMTLGYLVFQRADLG